MRRRGLLVPVVLALCSGACSLFIQPDESQLVPPDGAAVTDATMMHADVPPGTDVPVTGHDVPVATPDVPVMGTDVQPTCPSSCDDGVACTVDACNAATAMCTHTADSTTCGARMICDPHMGCIVHECTGDGDCSDGNVCNGVERCTAAHCVAGTAMVCDDGQFCDGTETCDPVAGCAHGAVPTCDDTNVCTTDRCDPTASGGHGACRNTPIVGCTAPPANDTCATATAITLGLASAVVMGTTVGAGDGVDSACGAMGGGDVWYAITYPSDADLTVAVSPSTDGGDTVLVARDGCTTPDLVCNDDVTHSDRGSRLWIRSSTATSTGASRTVYIVVDAYMHGAESGFALTAAATAPLDTTTCAAGGFDVTAGGTALGLLGRGPGAFSGTCGGGGSTGSEDIYHYAAPSGSMVQAGVRGGTFTPVIYARGGICEAGLELRCASGNPATIEYNQGGSGNSYIFVDNGTTGALSPYVMRIYGP